MTIKVKLCVSMSPVYGHGLRVEKNYLLVYHLMQNKAALEGL